MAQWGNSLAVRLPTTVVEALDLKPGDNIEIHVAGERAFAVEKPPGARELLAGLRKYVAGCPPISSSTGWTRMNEAEVVFDPNVVLYLLSADAPKADRAEQLLVMGA